jgi:hypothetical protein
VILVIVLVLFPVLVAIGGLVLAAVLGETSWREVERRHEGSELVDLNV